MAYDTERLTKLSALSVLATILKNNYTTKSEMSALDTRVQTLEAVEIPSKVSQLANDKTYQTQSEVDTAIARAVAEAGHITKQVVESLPSAEDAQDNVLYLLMNDRTGHYDIYGKIGSAVVLLDDTTVDLSGYATTGALSDALSSLSSDFDEKLSEMTATDAEVSEMLDSIFNPAPADPKEPEPGTGGE